MCLNIPLSANAEAHLARLASAAGSSPADFAARLVERAVMMPNADDALAPFRAQIAQSGIEDQQLDEFFEDLRNQVWRDKSPSAPDSTGDGRQAA
jgi:membrane-bound lytic murein transglycosylase B